MKLREYLLLLHTVLTTPKQEHFIYDYLVNNQIAEKDLPLGRSEFTDLLMKYDNYHFLQTSVVNDYMTLAENFVNFKEKYAQLPFLAICDSQYPRQLRESYEAPVILFYQGDLAYLSAPLLTIVGTRTMSDYGRKTLEAFIPELTAAGVTIVSGLAKGVDAYAQQLAIAENGRTIAVIGNGLDICYPAENRSLQHQIGEKGLLLSEYFPEVRPKQHHFPARNRILAALSSATLVIEAQERSGSLITAAYATQENRNVLAVPGNINGGCSAGTNQLIAAGARPALKFDDILNEIICY
ncbi:MAG: DNA-processing protein DprA [Oenococcus sp.]|uniref:DNA-processing protein DprA n=1 Tax=Oenococcus sp. TaxID=1979414 RepID=UPI0039EA5464